MQRVVLPEILDNLPSSDPRAIASRRDLLRINWLMGNSRWIISSLRKLLASKNSWKIMELGAGEGHLLASLSKKLDTHQYIGVDLVKQPPDFPETSHWHQGSVFELPATIANQANVVISNLFLHHFSHDEIQALFEKFPNNHYWVINEPYRDEKVLGLGKLINPFVCKVTKHDMGVSIQAGFRQGELLKHLDTNKWSIQESIDWRGSYRLILSRKHQSK